MSESLFKFYPLEPRRRFTDDEIAQIESRLKNDNASSIVVDSVSLVRFEGIQFIDCGNRLDRIACPKCGIEIAQGDWQAIMDSDYSQATGFELEKFVTCECGFACPLHELNYEAHCGFGIDCLSVRVVSHFLIGWLRIMPGIGVVEARY